MGFIPPPIPSALIPEEFKPDDGLADLERDRKNLREWQVMMDRQWAIGRACLLFAWVAFAVVTILLVL